MKKLLGIFTIIVLFINTSYGQIFGGSDSVYIKEVTWMLEIYPEHDQVVYIDNEIQKAKILDSTIKANVVLGKTTVSASDIRLKSTPRVAIQAIVLYGPKGEQTNIDGFAGVRVIEYITNNKTQEITEHTNIINSYQDSRDVIVISYARQINQPYQAAITFIFEQNRPWSQRDNHNWECITVNVAWNFFDWHIKARPYYRLDKHKVTYKTVQKN